MGRFVALVAAVLVVWFFTALIGHFVFGAWPSFGEALWKSTTHLLDPGSLEYDETAAERAIGLVQVIAGLVFLAGIVLTVLTEALGRALSSIRGSDPAIVREGHLLIVGFNPALSEVRRRLDHYTDGEPPEVVVLLPQSMEPLRDEARHALKHSEGRSTVLVADIHADGFSRACAGAAQRIVILSPDGDPEEADLIAMSYASALAAHLEPLGDSAPPVGVEMRRQRNVNAFWYIDRISGPLTDSDPGDRFPANFDGLVRDRIVGGTLSVAVANPAFARTFLDGASERGLGPSLIAGKPWAGLSFAEAQAELQPATLLGTLDGSGPTADAHYLPPRSARIEAGQRLIVIPRSPGHDSPAPTGFDQAQIKLSPARTGAVLLVGWSDSSRALVEDLDQIGYDGGSIFLLNPDRPRELPSSVGGGKPVLIAGSSTEPADIEHALEQASPSIVFVASPPKRQAAAVISGLLADQRTDVPIVVEQSSMDRASGVQAADDNLTVISVAGLVAEAIAVSCTDPAILVASQAMFDDPGLRLQALRYSSRDRLPLDGLGPAFAGTDSVPIAVALEGDPGDPPSLHMDDHILVLRRISRGGP